jgi:hypothetical protein
MLYEPDGLDIGFQQISIDKFDICKLFICEIFLGGLFLTFHFILNLRRKNYGLFKTGR